MSLPDSLSLPPSADAASASPTPLPQNGDSHSTSSAQASDRTEAITQGKEKAKAVMAASLQGASNASTPTSRPSSSTPATAAPDKLNNATPLSRKRSRSGSRIPAAPAEPRPKTQQLFAKQYSYRDQEHVSALVKNENRFQQSSDLLNAELVEWERFRARTRATAQRFPTHPVYSIQKRRPFGRRARALHVSRQGRAEQAEPLEDLVPVRIEVEFDKLRLRDTFTWNLHDSTVPLDIFVDTLVEDFKIPSAPDGGNNGPDGFFKHEIKQQMMEQITDYHPHLYIEDEPLSAHMPYTAYKNDEMRVQIKLNITIGQHTLVDNFDWDINNPTNSPEAFARMMARDLSLSGEFMTAIAHDIREQCQLFTKGLYVAAHPFDGREVEDATVRDSFLQSPLPSVFRSFQSAKDFQPYFYELGEGDLERTEHAFQREQRQQKRSGNRRGGPSLPDFKERPKTMRTMVVSTVIPGAAEAVEKSGIYKTLRARRKPWNAGRGDDSDVSESEESEIDSPARSALQGTSRTRGMRGAAAAAASAMRQTLARSQTPEIQRPPESKQTSRRLGAGPLFDDVDDNGNRILVVKLKLPRERFRQFWREWKRNLPKWEEEQRRKQAEAARAQASQQQASANGTPAPQGAMGPPSTPGASQRQLSQRPGSNDPAQARTAAEGTATPTPPPGQSANSQAPPIPQWLLAALPALQRQYPHDHVEAVMRYDKERQKWAPKMRCLDCPGMAYSVSEDDPSLANFQRHLGLNSSHVEKRERRLKGE